REHNEAVGHIRNGEDEVLGAVVGIEGVKILQRDTRRLPAIDREIEIAGNGRRDVAQLGGKRATHLHAELAVFDVAGHLAGAADAHDLTDDNIALQVPADFGRCGLYAAIASSAGLHDEVVHDDVALDVAEYLQAPRVADFPLEESVFSN